MFALHVCSGIRSEDYEKLVDREVRAAIQRMQAAQDQQQQGLRQWRLPESLKVPCLTLTSHHFASLQLVLFILLHLHVCVLQRFCNMPRRAASSRQWRLPESLKVPCLLFIALQPTPLTSLHTALDCTALHFSS